MSNLLAFDQHPRIKVNTIQNDLHMLSSFLEEEIEKDLTSDELYDILSTVKLEMDLLKEF